MRRLQLISVANFTSYAGESILLRALTYKFEPSFKEQRCSQSGGVKSCLSWKICVVQLGQILLKILSPKVHKYSPYCLVIRQLGPNRYRDKCASGRERGMVTVLSLVSTYATFTGRCIFHGFICSLEIAGSILFHWDSAASA